MVANSTYLDTVLPDDVDESRARLQSLLHGQQADVHMEKLYRRKDGSMFWGDVSACLIHDQPEDTRAIIAIVADITERKRIEEALHHANEQLRHWNSQLERYNRDIMLLNNMSEMLQRCVNEQEAYQVTAEFISHLFSECSGALYRQEHDTVQAVSLWGEQREWVPSFEPQTCEALLRQRIHLPGEDRGIFSCPHIIPASQHHTLCMPITNQHETFGVLCLSSTKLYQEDTRGHTERLAVMISEHLSLTLTNLRLRERLHEQATRDALTGLYNRRYLEEALEYELQKAIRYQRPIGIIMLDIDYFKQFNDTYGHDGGDELLRAVGNFLQRHTRDTDVACRYGGEEFTLILPEATLEDTQRRAEDLCTGIKDLHVQHNGRMLGTITISLGVAGFPRDGRSVATVLRAADLALLQAKTEGRNRLVIARSVG
jgi:diguanylate cyclase (GGDEF)-like protein